jgi:hypothetical protein
LPLKLYHIEEAVRTHFIFEGKARRPKESDEQWEKRIACQHSLYTSKEVEGSPLMGLAVFIGVSRMYGFPPSEIRDYLGLDSCLFKECLNLYDRFLEQAISIKLGGGDIPVGSKAGKVYIKTSLLRNFINRKFPV